MDSRGLALVALLAAAPALVFACGGKTGGEGDGGPGSSSSSGGGSGGSSGSSSGGVSSGSSGSSSGTEPVDATPSIDSPAPILCMGMGGGGSSGGPSEGGPPPCEVTASETCSDGNMYSVDCQCPQGTCTCTQTGTNGGSSGGGFSYPGCPSCIQTPDLFSICGFPQ
jgi:hypothetical protein